MTLESAPISLNSCSKACFRAGQSFCTAAANVPYHLKASPSMTPLKSLLVVSTSPSSLAAKVAKYCSIQSSTSWLPSPLNLLYLIQKEGAILTLSLIHISEPTRLGMISYAVFCLDLHLSIRRQRQMCIRDRYCSIQSSTSWLPSPLNLLYLIQKEGAILT